jgi:AdoMet-dependent heme synthase
MDGSLDLNQRPLVVLWETTQACDLSCLSCPSSARPQRSAQELSTEEARKFIDDVAELRPAIFILTGGDPLKRFDIYHLVDYAASRKLRPAMTAVASALLTRTAIRELKNAGLSRVAISLDGSMAGIHDRFRGVRGSYSRTLETIYWANEAGLPVQINTCVSRRNMRDLENLAALLEQFRIVLWSSFFFVPRGPEQAADLPSAREFEEVFATLNRLSGRVPFRIKTTEAQHYRRFVLQHRYHHEVTLAADSAGAAPEHGSAGLLPINDGRGMIFVSHSGEVFPSGFLPVPAGSVRTASLATIYRDAPLLRSLRDTANLKGRCGVCEFREICGGCRARAYAMTGDMFAEDPCCAHQPHARAHVA